MKESKIKFVRVYEWYGTTMYDVVYKSWRLYTFSENDVPKTALLYMFQCDKPKYQYDKTFNRHELIYELA